MKRSILLLAIAFVISLLIIQCRHEPEKPPISGNTCHPDTVYFKRDILPLLLSSCAYAGCHDAATAMDGVKLDNYENVMATADVKPGNPNSSDLYEVLVEDDEDKRMPRPPFPRLSNEQIAMVRKWIQQGAKNNDCSDE